MARVPDLRHPRQSVTAAAVAVLATGAAFATLLALHGTHRPATPPVVARALGSADPSAPLARRYAPRTSAGVTASGVRVATRTGRVALRLAGAHAGPWTRHANGADRETSFGRESIVFQPQGVEQLLTVARAQGRRTWRWHLDGVHGRLDRAGGVLLHALDGGASDTRIAPVLVLDGKGGNVTPLGLRWRIANAARGATLSLTFDDRRLPLPYVIDPAIAIIGACGVDTSNATAVAAGCAAGQTSKGTSLTIPVPGTSGVAAGTLLVAQVTVNGTPAITAPNCNGTTKWTQIGTTTQNTMEQAIYWCVPTAAVAGGTNYVWSYGSSMDASGGITAWSNVNTSQPVDLSATNPGPGWATATGTGTSIPTPTAYANQAGTQILAFYGGRISNGGTITQNTGTGITQEYTVNSTTSNSRARSTMADIAQPGTGAVTTLTATASSSIPWVAQTIALQAPYSADGGGTMTVSPTSVNKSSTGNAFAFTYTAASGGTNSGQLTVLVPAGWTTPTLGNLSVSCASCFGTAPSVTVSGMTITVSNVSLAQGNSLTLNWSGVTAPSTAGTATFTTNERSSSTGTLTALAAQPTVSVLGQPSAVSFTPGSSTYGATTTYTAQFTATSSGALVAGNTVTATFDPAYSGLIPASPSVTFGGGFAGCAAGATGSTSANVVTITLPTGCTLANAGTGSVAIAGIVNPAAGVYAATGFKVRTTADAVDASATAGVTIAKKALTMTGVTATSKTYDGSATATVAFGGASLVGVVGGDTVTFDASGATGAFPAKTVGAGLTVTVSGVVLGGTSAGNYTLTQPTATASITAKALTVTGITAANKVYNGTTGATLNTGSAALSGVVAGDTVTLSTTGATGSFASKTVGTGKTVTVAGLTISGADAGNYSLTQPTTTANITTATLTVTGVTAQNKTYDATTGATLNTGSAVLSGVVAGDTVTLSTAGATGSFATKTVGTGKTVTVAGLTISGADAGNYSLTQPTTTANITTATLTVTGVTAQNKTYDATTGATLSTGSAALSGVLAGDTVTLSTAGATGSFATKTVGTGKTVTVAGLTISGADAGNYTLTQPTTTANITTATLTVTGVGAQNKVYDRTTAATLTGTAALSGVVAGDTVSLGGTPTASFADRNVGVGKAVTVTGYTISGADAANYTLTQPTPTATITAKALTVAGVAAANKVYDSTTAATLTGTATLSGVVAGDTVTLGGTPTASFATKTVGTGKAVTVTGYTISGTDAGNYTLTQPSSTANITTAPLTVTGITASSRTYDATTTAALGTVGAALAGVLGSDAVTLSTAGATGSFATKTVGTGKTVTVAGLTISGADAGNYALAQPTTTADITAAPLTVSGITAQNKVYDGTAAATLTGTAALSGVVAGDTVSLGGSPSASFAAKTVGANKPVTVTGYTISGADGGNYTLTQPSPTATITAKTLTITGVGAANKVYDRTTAATLTGTAALNGVVAGDTVTLGGTPGGSFASATVGAAKAVTIGGYTLGGGDAGNYSLTQPTASADITAKALTVTGVSAASKTYDGSTTATLGTVGAALAGVVAGDTVTLSTAGATGSFSTKTVGTGKTVTVAGLTISGADAGNYTLTQPTTTADITPKGLTVTGVTAANRVYDATTGVVLNTGSAALAGVVGSDAVALSTGGATGSFATKTVGAAKTVTVAGLTISGADAGNYTLTQPTTTADITAKTLTVSGVTAASRVYDGTTTATLSTGGAALVGVLGGDAVTLSTAGATGSFATKTVGTGKTVTVAGLTISGADAGNYTLTQPAPTANVTAATLTVGGVTAQDKQYDGGTSASLTGTPSLVGVASGDTVTVGGSPSASFANATVGAGKTVTVGGYTLGGADAANYTLTQPTLSAAITRKPLTIAGATAAGKTYDGTNAATVNLNSATLNGVVGSDFVSIDASGATATFASRNAGTGVAITVAGVALGGTDAGNYSVAQPTGLAADIAPKGLTIANAVAADKSYDGTTNATVDFSGAALNGVVGSDSVSISSAGATTLFSGKDVGGNLAVTVTGVALAGTDAGNYTVAQPTGLTASITPKNLTVSGAVANDKPYDGNTTATVSFSGASLLGTVGGDDVSLDTSGYGATFATPNAGTGIAVTVTGVALAGTARGDYTVSQPGGLTASITGRPLTLTGAVAVSKTYDGSTAATVNFSGASLQGVVNGDSVSLSTAGYTASFATKHAGTGIAVTVAGVALTGADAGKYQLTQPSGLTADIAKKTLTVGGATVAGKVYDGSTAATLDLSGATLQGVVAGDTVSIDGTGATAQFASKDAGGSVPVTVGGVALSGPSAADYTLAQPTGLSAAITRKPLKVAGATASGKTYDGTTNATVDLSGATPSGVVGADAVTIDGSGANAAFASKHVGTGIAITVTGVGLGGAAAGDYTVAQPTGLTADITPKHLTVTGATANGKTYDGGTAATVDFTGASLTGVVGSDDVTIDHSGYSASFASAQAGSGIAVTVTGVVLGGTSAGDYDVSQPSGLTATIAKKALTVTGASANGKTYDGTTTATVDFSGATLNGVVGSDSVSIDHSSYAASFAAAAAGTNVPVTVTGVALSGADAANYTVAQPAGLTATIAKAPLTVTGASANGRTYDGTTNATVSFAGASLAGTASGDDVTLDTSGYTASFATRHVGTGIAVTVGGVALAGTAKANYTLAQPSGLSATIAQRPITVTAQPDTKAYDTTTASSVVPAITSGSLAAGDTASFTQSFDTPAVGTGKTLTPSGSVADGNSGNDYAVTFATGSGTITAATATKLVFTQAPSTATGGTLFATQPEVTVEDAYGNVVTSDDSTTVTLSIGTNPSGGTLSCPGSTTTVTVSNGVASFAGCRIDRKGSGYTLTTTNGGGLTDATTAPFDVVAVSTKLVITSVNGGSSPTAGSGFSVVVEAQDGVGNSGDVASDTPVTLSLASGTGTLGGTLTGTMLAGTSSVTISGVTYTKAESGVALTARGGSLADATSGTFTVDAGPATQLAFGSVPATADAVSAFSVTVQAQDAFGNPAKVGADVAVSLGLDSHSGSGPAGTLSGASGTISTGSSNVTLSGVRYTRAEDITLGASAPGMTGSGSSSTITVAPGPLAGLQVLLPGETAAPGTPSGKTGSPAAQTATTPFSVVVNAVDANWNRVGSTHTVSLSSSDAAAQLPADTALAGGTASLQVTLETRGSGTQTVTASDATDGSVSAGTSAPVSLGVGGVSASRSTVSAPATVVADGTTTGTITVTLVDGGGNAVAGKTVSLAQGGGSSTISPASAVTDAAGRATFTVKDATAEVVTYTATDTDDGTTVTQTGAVSFEDSVPPSVALGLPADAVTAAGSLTLTATGVSDGQTGVGGVDFRYCDSTTGACDPTAGGTLAAADAGGGTWSAALDTTGLVGGHTYTWLGVARDRAGNTTATASRSFAVDNSAPAVAFSAPTILGGASAQHWDGTTATLWLRGGSSGSFALNAAASDPQSGIAKVTFPALLGTPAADATTPPYASGTYSFSNPSSDLVATVTATNGVTAGSGTRTATDSLNVRVDSAGPSATLDASLNGTTVSSGVVLQAASSDAGSGVAQVGFLFCDRTATPLCTPNVSAGSTSTQVGGVYSLAWDTTGLVDGHSYAVAAESTDEVGNVTDSGVATVVVDDSAPTVAATAPTTSGDTYWNGSTLFVKTTGTGSYTLHAQASDADSGIASVTFGSDAGTAQGGGAYASPAYTLNGAETSSTVTVTAANGVTRPTPLTATDRVQIVADGTPATTATQFPVVSGTYDPTTWPTGSQSCTGTQPEGICGTVSDTGSGVAAVKLTLQDLGGGTYFDGTGFSAGQTVLSATVSGSTWSYPLDHTKLSTASYELKVWGLDEVGNVETVHTIDFDYGTDLTPPDTQLTLGGTHAYLLEVGTHPSPRAGRDYDLFYSPQAGGDFTLHAHATDDSGIDRITFPTIFGTAGVTRTNGTANPWDVDSPTYSFDSSDSTAPGQAVVTSVDTRGNTGDDTLTFLVDDTKPSGGAVAVSPIDGNGYATTLNLTLSHTAFADGPTGSGMQGPTTLTVASAPLADGTCGTFGADAPTADGGFTATDGTCYRFTATGTDNVGNVATATQIVKVDTTAPSKPTVAFGGLSSGNTYDDGAGTLWYRPSAGGTFSVTASSTDAESGLQGYTFSSLLGGTQSGGRDDVTFGAGGVGSGSYTVHATNRAGLDSADATFSVQSDAAAPVNGALTVNGTAAAATATSSYVTSGSTVSIDARTNYTDGGSGLAGSLLTVASAPLAGDACGTYGAATTISGTTAQSVSSGDCYRFTLTGTDNVGNVASVLTVVKVDTTPPTTPSVVFSGLSAGNTYDAGNGTLWYRPSAGGTFTATATGAADPETGVQGFTFSSLLGGTQSGNRLDVTFGAAGVGSGSYGVVATNDANVDSAAAPFTVNADTIAPTGGLLSVAPYAGSLAVSIGESDFEDGQSGIASNTLTRSDPQAPSGGSCPASGYTGAAAVAVSGGTASDTVPTDGRCYEYTLTGTDHVGNSATYTTIVLVDSTAPTGGSVQSPDGPTTLNAISVDWNAGSDPESGIGQVSVQRATSTLNGSACDPLGPFTTIVPSASTSPVVDSAVAAGNCYAYRIVVTNHAGVAATFTSSTVTKLTSGSPIAVDTSTGGTYLAGTTLWVGRSTTFGLKLTSVGATGVDSADWSASSGSLTGSATSATTAPFTSGTYTWDGTAPLNASISVTRQPTATVDTLTVQSDTTAPTGTVQYPNGINPSHSVPVTTASIADGESGVDGGSVQILRSETTLVGSTCGTTWSAYAPVAITGGNDTTVQDSHCYRYELVVSDNVGNQHTDTPANVVQIPDITPPSLSSADTNAAGTQLTLHMSEPLDATSVPSASRFTVSFDGVAQPVPTGVTISGGDVVLDLATPPDNSQTVTVSYSSDGSLRDTAVPTKNATPSFGPSAVTNGTTDTVAPHVTSATVDGSTLTLQLDEAVTGNAPAASAFTVTVGGVARTVTAVATGGKTVTLTLSPAVAANQTVVVDYAVPALDALHDAAGNPVAPFTSSVTNTTAAVVAPPVVTPPVGPPAAPGAPALVTETPSDGATVASASSLTLTANQPVTWSGMTLTRPDGTVVPLPSGTGAAWTWTPDTTTPGLYVVRGSIGSGGRTTSVLSHFTVWAPGSAGTAPTVQKNAGPVADSLVSSDGTVAAAWSAATFGEPVVVQIDPKSPTALSLPPSALAVDVTAFLRDSHVPVTQLGDVIDVQFRNAPAGSTLQMSQDTKSWSTIVSLPTLQLPAGQAAGWFRDSDGTVHVLTRHLTYYALIVPQASTKLALNIVTPRRLWLDGRSFMGVRIVVTAPARVTGSFVAPDGTVIPGQVIKTPTRRAGATILRVPLHVTKPGLYRLQVHANGIGQVANKTGLIQFVQHRPEHVWQSARRLRVAVVDGVRLDGSDLGGGFALTPVADADLYRAVDPQYRSAAAAVVVDLATVPIPSLGSLHALLPELRIVGVTQNRRLAAAARAAGVDVVGSPRAAARTLRSLFPGR